MQVQVNASNGIENKEALERWATAELRDNLARFAEDTTRVEVHLSDETTGKTGGGDKRCTMEARLAHHPPVAVSNDAPTLDEAFRGASGKLHRLLEHTLAKVDHKRDRASIRKDVDAGIAPD
jgi:hypothetical protein